MSRLSAFSLKWQSETRRVILADFTNKWTKLRSAEPADSRHLRGIDTQNSLKGFREGNPPTQMYTDTVIAPF